MAPSLPRVLLLHNRYRAAGGEERVVEQMAALLAERGHAVSVLERSSGDAGAARAARGLLRGGLDADEVADAVRAHRADVVHAHNVHPLLGWRALAAARDAGARVVLHLHNYRLFCAIGVAYRDGQPCFACRGGDTRPGLRHRCRGSAGEAAVYAAGLARQRARLIDLPDALVAVSDAQARQLEWLGVPRGRLTVLPNFVLSPVASRSLADAGTYALAAGRLVEEKGFDVAILAARAAGVPLRIAGSGPDEERLRALAGADENVRFLGQLSAQELAAERAGAAVLLAPSRCDEAGPMAVVEALGDGLPVLASDRGALPELAGEGAWAPVADEAGWARMLGSLWADPALRRERGEAGIARVRAHHSPDVFYAGLTDVYG